MAKYHSNELIVVAIDFGTTYSGFACSYKHEYERDPLRIFAMNWPATGAVMSKTSTCVLFDEDKKFHSFGFEAEEKYKELAEDEKHECWYFFRRFKMKLYEEQNISRTTTLKDERGKMMPAIEVFAAGIRYLRHKGFEKCKDESINLFETDVQWVLTVPAIWSDKSKAFMREAAIKAGIRDDKLLLALEPETASIYCKEIAVQYPDKDSDIITFPAGSKYLVLDAGGGTIDITVHEITEDGSIKEIYKANGGDWGGTKVDKAFKGLLEDIYGKPVVDEFTRNHYADAVELLYDFDVKKRKISNKTDVEKISFRIPFSLNETYKKNNTVNPSHKPNPNGVWLTVGKLRIESTHVKKLFKPSIDKIVAHLWSVLQVPNVGNLDYLLMVGGYSESPMLQEAVKSEFENKLKIVIPKEAGLAVLKGAVMFGHNQSIMKTRICRYTYGISCARIFVEGKHREDKKFQTSDGKYHCKDLFSKIIDEGTEVVAGDSLPPVTLTPLEPNDTKWYTKIVASTKKDVEYITDEGCIILGPLVIDMPDTTRGRDRAVNYTLSFFSTEIQVTAKDRDSDRHVNARFKFI